MVAATCQAVMVHVSLLVVLLSKLMDWSRSGRS